MSKRAIAASAAVAVVALSGCARTGLANDRFVSKARAATVVGPAASCVQIRRIHDTRVWDDRTIDFVMDDGTRYRNTLPYRCPELGFQQRFAYKTSTTSLCSVDTITVLPTGSSIPGATCGLGKFVPVKLATTRPR
jgi:hypothetical protein